MESGWRVQQKYADGSNEPRVYKIKNRRKAKEGVIPHLVNEKTWERVEDTPFLPPLQAARKAEGNVGVKDDYSGTLVTVSRWNELIFSEILLDDTLHVPL